MGKSKSQKKIEISGITPYFLLIIGMLVFFRLLLLYISYYEDNILKNGAEVVGEIYSYGGKSTHFRFIYDNEKYEVNVDRAINTIVLGEKYFIKADKNNPTEVVVEWWKPVIDSSFNKIHPTDVDFEKSFLSENFDFTYIINDKSYTRVQRYPPNTDKQKSNNFVVYYKRENPQIAYLVGFN